MAAKSPAAAMTKDGHEEKCPPNWLSKACLARKMLTPKAISDTAMNQRVVTIDVLDAAGASVRLALDPKNTNRQ
ncbi:MAG: hypothetical protein ABGX07_02305, partial [Pirellulaceae bacterium]